ncbi:unnamed protein product [Ilex paraguariensis]|uniref:C2H2-type domain-containing protein n=1 Tax=Ilex paraguariensis TaxID=185542 RepID=A0ABC8RBQ5_9AQUA
MGQNVEVQRAITAEDSDLSWSTQSMEEAEELRFVCKLCDKRYPCGKSLGGHMRSHVIANSAESQEKVEAYMKKVSCFNGERNSSSKMETRFEFSGNPGYGLRENPKKTWRIVDSNNPLPQDKVCKQCGKGFQSLKALCGHMACHSEKERVWKDDHSWTSQNQKQVMDSDSDTEAGDPNQGRRSKSKRYKTFSVKSSFTFGNGSASVSEIDEQEQEEVAMCLIMLSRDSGIRGGVNSVVESSDNNSVVLETKSSSIDMRIGRKEVLNSVDNNGDETLRMKKLGGKKLKSSVLDDEIAQFESSDSDYFINGSKKVESDISDDGVLRNGEYKKLEVSGDAKIDESGAKLEKGVTKCYETGGEKDLIKKRVYYDSRIVPNSTNYDKRKRTKDGSYSPESSDAKAYENAHKRSKYECLTCKKAFSSFQALGGHRPCHKRNNVCINSRYESGENSIEGGINPDFIPNGKFQKSISYKNPIAKDLSCNAEKKSRSKKSKGHECPYCNRIFKSGQALGGHKRSHFIGGRENISNQTPLIKQDIPDLLDLNLPAPMDDEADGQVEFLPCGFESARTDQRGAPHMHKELPKVKPYNSKSQDKSVRGMVYAMIGSF